jgi:hypothetical protein
MSRLSVLVSLAALLGFLGPASADSLALVLELEGTLSERGGGFSLTVDGEGSWELDLPPELRTTAKESLRRYASPKMFVVGSVRVRSFESTVQLNSRAVKVTALDRAVPGVKVLTTVPGLPAATLLQPGDIIRELNEDEITSYERLIETVEKNRGKTVKCVVTRDGVAKLIEGLALRAEGRALGVTGETVWTSPSRGGAGVLMTGPEAKERK